MQENRKNYAKKVFYFVAAAAAKVLRPMRLRLRHTHTLSPSLSHKQKDTHSHTHLAACLLAMSFVLVSRRVSLRIPRGNINHNNFAMQQWAGGTAERPRCRISLWHVLYLLRVDVLLMASFHCIEALSRPPGQNDCRKPPKRPTDTAVRPAVHTSPARPFRISCPVSRIPNTVAASLLACVRRWVRACVPPCICNSWQHVQHKNILK